MKYKNDNVFTGEFRNGKPSNGAMFFKNNIIFSGKFDENGQFFEGKKIQPDGIVFDGSWKNDKSLDVSAIIKLSKTGKAYCSYRAGKNNLQREIEYCLKDDYGNFIKAATINYEKINEILNGKDNRINNLDDLIKSEAIKGINNFNELKDFTKKMLQDRMSGGIIEGFVGAHHSLDSLLLLSSVDTVEQLKKTRFQLYYTKEGEDSLREDYGSLTNFLKSVGIDSIGNVEDNYISLRIEILPQGHAVSVILDIKKMKELMEETGKKDLDEAIGNEKVIHCFDSSRTLGCPVAGDNSKTNYNNIGALGKNCDFVNLEQQELYSCWFQAAAATLTALKYPEVVKRITNGEIELYNVEHRLAGEDDEPNEFQFRQMHTIIEVSEKFNIGPMEDNREPIDVLIRDNMKTKVEGTVLDMTEDLLGR
jgi:hypothetical protein